MLVLVYIEIKNIKLLLSKQLMNKKYNEWIYKYYKSV